MTPTEQNFRRQLAKDAVRILLIAATCSIGIVLTLYFSAKGGW